MWSSVPGNEREARPGGKYKGFAEHIDKFEPSIIRDVGRLRNNRTGDAIKDPFQDRGKEGRALAACLWVVYVQRGIAAGPQTGPQDLEVGISAGSEELRPKQERRRRVSTRQQKQKQDTPLHKDAKRTPVIRDTKALKRLPPKEILRKFEQGAVEMKDPEIYKVVRTAMATIYGTAIGHAELIDIQTLCQAGIKLEKTITVEFLINLRDGNVEEYETSDIDDVMVKMEPAASISQAFVSDDMHVEEANDQSATPTVASPRHTGGEGFEDPPAQHLQEAVSHKPNSSAAPINGSHVEVRSIPFLWTALLSNYFRYLILPRRWTTKPMSQSHLSKKAVLK